MTATLQPYVAFEDNLKPALLMLDVYRLLITEDGPKDAHELLDELRRLVCCEDDEELLLLQSEMFIGLVRERAEVSKGRLKPKFLANLLRQAVVCAVTALETYLPALLREHLPRAIELSGRDLLSGKKRAAEWLKDLQFQVTDVIEVWQLPASQMAERLTTKIVSYAGYKYLASSNGVEVTGNLLQLDEPWDRIAGHLERDPDDLKKTIGGAFRRRNDIVHRADRGQKDPSGMQQEITYEWACQAVSTIEVASRSLNTLVVQELNELAARRATTQ